MPRDTIAVVMGALPDRKAMREVAVGSVERQVGVGRVPVVLSVDHRGEGCGAMKNAGLARTDSIWTAFLDDDDWYFPEHLRTLFDASRGADLVYSLPIIWDGPGRSEPWPRSPFDPEALFRRNYIPCGYMVRTEVARSVGGFPERTPEVPYSDWGFLLRLLEAGATFAYVERWTWAFRRWSGNTSSWGKHPGVQQTT